MLSRKDAASYGAAIRVEDQEINGISNAVSSKPQPEKSQAIHATLSGSNQCSAEGLTATGAAPALALCRELLAAGLDPDRALEVYRGTTLALRIRTIGEGARLTVKDDNRGVPRFGAYRPGPAERGRIACGEAPSVAQNPSTATPPTRHGLSAPMGDIAASVALLARSATEEYEALIREAGRVCLSN